MVERSHCDSKSKITSQVSEGTALYEIADALTGLLDVSAGYHGGDIVVTIQLSVDEFVELKL